MATTMREMSAWEKTLDQAVAQLEREYEALNREAIRLHRRAEIARASARLGTLTAKLTSLETFLERRLRRPKDKDGLRSICKCCERAKIEGSEFCNRHNENSPPWED